MFQYITDRSEGLEEVLNGGCRWVQLRMKDATEEEIVSVGHEVAGLCRRYGARFIIDDHVELVDRLQADGVHLGQNDMAVDEARRILGDGKIIGATANTREHIDKALSLGRLPWCRSIPLHDHQEKPKPRIGSRRLPSADESKSPGTSRSHRRNHR